MNKIDLSIRLRPIRFAYLVNPSDIKSLLKIFESNTCLWGGMFNPIIPFYKKTPDWWSNYPFKRDNFRQIVEGYLNYFEPDFIVESNQGLAKQFGIPEEFTISLDELIVNKSVYGETWNAYGLNAFDIYKSLYQQELKFQRRHREKFAIINSKIKKYKLIAACLFGSFSENTNSAYIESAFKDVFNPDIIEFDKKTIISIYENKIITPLRISRTKYRVYDSSRNEPMLYFFDETKSQDLVDFWNLRIIYPEAIAIPIQFLDVLKKFCQDYIIRNNIQLPGSNGGYKVHTTLQPSRSITYNKIEDIFKEYLNAEKKGGATISSTYPSIWKDSPEFVWRPKRSVLNGGEKRIEITMEPSYRGITFETLSPDFPERIRNRYRWANVVNLSDWSFKDEVTTIYPDNLFNPSFPRISQQGKMRTNSEGLIIFPRHKESKDFWTLSDGTSAMINYLNIKKMKAEISDAGKTLQQIVRTIGGLHSARLIANPKLLELLNKMAHKQVKSEKNENEIVKEYLGRTVQYSEINKLINEITQSQFFSSTDLASLISNKVIQLGLEVECEQCGNRNWYLINNLDYKLSCENCLNQYDFPSANPTNRKINWSYRVIGPFSKPDYAGGGYSAALALRLFRDNLGSFSDSKISWSTSLNLETGNKQKWEIDFLLWYQRERIIENNYRIEFIAGESKSFGMQSFRRKDVQSLKRMATFFPGSILVFATMKNELSKEEKQIITPLALWGRESLKNGKTRAPVVILTATELFATDDLRSIYTNKGGQFAKIVSPAYVDLGNLRVLSNITQQIHLGMNSYHSWLEEKYKKIKKSS
jgi:hypothetical protein